MHTVHWSNKLQSETPSLVDHSGRTITVNGDSSLQGPGAYGEVVSKGQSREQDSSNDQSRTEKVVSKGRSREQDSSIDHVHTEK